MEKLQEYRSTNSVTSTFKVNLQDLHPIGTKGIKIGHSTRCGLGWRFAILNDPNTTKINAVFDPHIVGTNLGLLVVTVILHAEDSSDSTCKNREQRLFNSTKHNMATIAVWSLLKFNCNSYLTFKVYCVGVDPDLPSPKLQSDTRSALRHSVQSGIFVDTKSLVFSRRLLPGRVGHANSTLL